MRVACAVLVFAALAAFAPRAVADLTIGVCVVGGDFETEATGVPGGFVGVVVGATSPYAGVHTSQGSFRSQCAHGEGEADARACASSGESFCGSASVRALP